MAKLLAALGSCIASSSPLTCIANFSAPCPIFSADIFIPSDNNEHDIGPLWLGKLHNRDAVKEIRTILFKKELNTKNSIWKLLSLFEEESNAPPFFYTTDDLASKLKMSPPKKEKIYEKLNHHGFKVYQTHFSPTAFKTNADYDAIKMVFDEVKILQKINFN